MQLATVYASPGLLLLAQTDAGDRVGCVGLRSLTAPDGTLIGEMRRLFVRRSHRKDGVGGALVDALIRHARAEGLTRLVLNTLPAMSAAHKLYETVGFEPSPPHVSDPAEGTLYFSLDL